MRLTNSRYSARVLPDIGAGDTSRRPTFDLHIGYLLGEYKEQTQDKHFICQQTGLTETAIDLLLPHSQDWQTGVLSLLLEEYPDFLQVLANIYEYYNYYAKEKNDKKKYARESFKVRAETKGIDNADWEKIIEAEKIRTVTNDGMEQNTRLVKAQRLSVYESFISVVDKIVEQQYKKNSKNTK